MNSKKIRRLFLSLFLSISLFFPLVGLFANSIEAASYPTGWSRSTSSRNGEYYAYSDWRITSMNGDTATIEIRDTVGIDKPKTTYWTGHTDYYEVVNGQEKYLGRNWVPTDYRRFQQDSQSVSLTIKGYGMHHIRGKDVPFGVVVVASQANFNIFIPRPTYKNKVEHWMWGFEKGEGNNGSKNAFHMGNTYTGDYNSGNNVLLNAALAKRIPNGYYQEQIVGSNEFTGSWEKRPLPQTITQKDRVMNFQYDYKPYQYSISYDVNGGDALANPPKEYNVLYGPKLPVPTRKGYTFDGWLIEGTNKKVTEINYDLNNKFSSVDAMYSELDNRVTGDKNLIAQWIPNKYNVTYRGNGGAWNGCDSWKDGITYDDQYIVKKNRFEKMGYEFAGWNTRKDGTGDDWTPKIDKEFQWTLDHDVTLYAQWKPIQYTVIFSGNGHSSGQTPDQTMTYDQAESLHKNGYIRENSDFIKWNTKPDGSGKSYEDRHVVKNLSTIKGDVVTLYAQWDDVPVLIVQDGAYVKGENVTIKDVIEDSAKAEDREDGVITSQIQVDKILYPDGTEVNHPKPTDALNTDWKNKDKIKVTVSVTDSFGHTIKKEFIVLIIDLDAPEIGGGSTPGQASKKPSVYNRYINKGYQWSLEDGSVWNQNPEYREELEDVLNSLK